MCHPVIAAGLAIVSGISEYQTNSAIAKHSNRVADAQIEAANMARNNEARALNARETQEQEAVAEKRLSDKLLAQKAIEKQKVLNAETGAEGRSIDLSVINKENQLLKYDTNVNRTIDDISTAFAYRREGLESKLANRIMQADASRKAKPSLGAAIVKTAANATMAYGNANGGFGEGTASFGENLNSLTDFNMPSFDMPSYNMPTFEMPTFDFWSTT